MTPHFAKPTSHNEREDHFRTIPVGDYNWPEVLKELMNTPLPDHIESLDRKMDELGVILERCQKSCEWQDISSAPKDGTSILIYGSFQMMVARWGDISLFGTSQDWVYGDCHGEYNAMDRFDSPTHWMPLPPLPPIAPIITA